MDPLFPTLDFLIYESSVIIPILEMNKFNTVFKSKTVRKAIYVFF